MDQKTIRNDLLKILIMVVIFAAALSYLKFYDTKSDKIDIIGQKAVGSLLK